MAQKKSAFKSTPKDVFSHLLAIITLYIGVISFLTLIFQYINIIFPDPLQYFDYNYTTISGSMAALLVSWPVYLLMMWQMGKDMYQHPGKTGLRIRKWLFYFTLFVAAITIIIDLITLLSGFFQGELTTRFGLKTLAVLIVAILVFAYYLWDLKRPFKTKDRLPHIAAWVTSILIIAAIAGGFYLAGTPGEQRARRLDEQRVQDLQSIQANIINYRMRKDQLPPDLPALEDPIIAYQLPNDPQTGQFYEYRVINELTFELCATFETSSTELPRPRIPQPTPISRGIETEFTHEQGRQCFERSIDPDFYEDQKELRIPEPRTIPY